MNTTHSWLLFWLVLVACLSGGALVCADENLPEKTLLPGGVADPSGEVGYVQHADGTVDAIDLKSGRTLWNLPEKGRPVGFHDKRLFVQAPGRNANEVHFLVVDAVKGVLLRKSEPIVFPDWASVVRVRGRMFHCQTHLDEMGRPHLVWEARAFLEIGDKSTEEEQARARKNASGVARLDPDSGKVEALDAGRVQLEPKLPKKLEGLRSQHGVSYHEKSDSGPKPMIVGGKAIVLVRKGGTGKSEDEALELHLQAYDLRTGEEISTRLLAKGWGIGATLTSDRMKMLVYRPDPKGADIVDDGVYDVFDLDTGKRLATVPKVKYARQHNLLGKRFFALTEVGRTRPGGRSELVRVLRAFDADTGVGIWERQVLAPSVFGK